MNARLDAITFGEAMTMFVADQPGPLEQALQFHKRTAGAETNVAIGLSRLGLRVGWASRLGDDSMGRYLLDAIGGEGVDCSHVTLNAGERTAFQFKARRIEGGDPLVEYHRKGSAAAAMGVQHLDAAWLCAARHLHVTGIFPALSPSTLELTQRAIELMREAGRSISFDPNLRPSLWPSAAAMRETLNALAARCHTVLPGIEEGYVLTGSRDPVEIARWYRERGAQRVVVKLGVEGAYFDDRDAGCGRVAAFPVAEVVDTVGAGDGFAVGVISGLLDGAPIDAAVRRGAWIGARAVQVTGDTEGLPTRAQLNETGPPCSRGLRGLGGEEN